MQHSPASVCVRGHVQDAATRIVRPNGTGYCRTCQYTLDRSRRQRSSGAQGWPTTPEDLQTMMRQVHRTGTCWLWRGPVALGQPVFYRLGAHYSAARFAYESCQGALAVADHVLRSCGEPMCISPSRGHAAVHQQSDAGLRRALSVVDGSGNNRGRTHCKRGHAFTAENTGHNGGARYCRMCKSLLNRAKKPRHQSPITLSVRTVDYVEALKTKSCICARCAPDQVLGPAVLRATRNGLADLARFLSGFTATTSDACWLWQRARNADGYGNFSVKSRPVLAHRYAYEMFRSPLTPRIPLRHACENTHCVNPAHLEPSHWGPRFRLDVPKLSAKQARSRAASACEPSAASAAAAPHPPC